MAKYTDAVCRLCRRESQKLFLKGDRCYSGKCAMERKRGQFPPGAHAQGRGRKPTEYSLQLREKQKVRRMYGVLEKQFRNYFTTASRQRGMTGENLLRLLERRLDNVVFRLGFAASRAEARQMVTHGHITLNGKRVDIPSYLVEVGEVITFKESSRGNNRVKELTEALRDRQAPAWLSVDTAKASGTVLALPNREDIQAPIEEHLIVEKYSR
ncbi:MAG: 30S ribosomal protein S4 [Gracilibacteraceae bacterium]|jgi:small subunit ribosomal protein S4|nr:30S ribosomal protein S4 [Gracilibacteraceae bacterium]